MELLRAQKKLIYHTKDLFGFMLEELQLRKI